MYFQRFVLIEEDAGREKHGMHERFNKEHGRPLKDLAKQLFSWINDVCGGAR